jgi:hypothetical protein
MAAAVAAAAARDRRKKIIAFFHVLWLFIGKKHVLSKKKFSKFWSETNTFPYIFHICGK